jgi:predicted ATPase/DNA-binding SARP family transcriptional activator
MEFGILGPVEARDGGRAIELGGKQRALLAVLLLHANEPVSAEAIAIALWGEEAPAQAIKTVQVNVSRLRRALGDPRAPVTTAAGYRLDVAPDALDAERFRRLVEAGRQALEEQRPADAGGLLRDALALWRGPPLADLLHEPFAQAGVAALEEERLAAIELRVEADLACGRHAELAGELQRLVAEHPLRERLHGRLMLALYRSGRQADALDAFRRARNALVDGLGIEPGAELRELERAILLQDDSLDARGDALPAVHVPLPPTPTVGRAADLDRLRAALRDGRLVTIVGPGGVGKTRLALELGHAAGREWRDGARFVALAGLGAAEHVTSTLVRRLEIEPFSGEPPEEALARALGRRELLLIIDNFEHVLDAAPAVADLLASAPGLTVLATSREPLSLRAERLFRLDALAPPHAEALFAAVARAQDARFEGDGEVVADLCRRLDHLPLAIELAAGRVGVLSLPELERLVAQGAGALGPAPRDAPARQRTLTATLEWSHALLTGSEQDAFAALSVFAGGCTVDAAQAVTGATLSTLEGLVAKNLVVAQPSVPRRLALLETVREFAAERLTDADVVRERHALHYLALAERVHAELRLGEADAREYDAELDNLRAALAWSLARPEPVLALRLAAALGVYWDRRGFDAEGVAWLGAALELPAAGVPPEVRADALEAYVLNLGNPGQLERAQAAADECLLLRRSLGDVEGCSAILHGRARVLLNANRVEEAYGYAREAERLARECGDEEARQFAVRALALAAPTLDEALTLGQQAIAADRAAGRRRRLAAIESDLSYTALYFADYETARQLSGDAFRLGEVLDDPHLQAFASGNTGLAALLLGDVDEACDAFARELRLALRHRLDRIVFESLSGLAAVAAAQGRDMRAAALLGAAETRPERHDPVIAEALERTCFAGARARLGEAGWRESYAAGAALELEDAVEAALRVAAGVGGLLPA